MGTVVAVTLTSQEVEAGTMHSDLYMSTYMDFAQNKGRYVVGSGVNALLGHIRTHVDKGITIHYTDGTPSYTIANNQGMISYMGVHDGGYAAAIAPNFLATVAHNGEIDASFSERVVGDEHAVNYAAVGVRSGYNGPIEGVVFRLVATTESGEIYDYCLQRQTKIFTDVAWNPVTTITNPEEKLGDYQYHAGAGSMNMWSETDGKYHFNNGSLIGSIKQIETAPNWGNGNFSVNSSPNYGDGVGATLQDPLPHGTEGGDSGSPVFIYNAATGQYEYIAAHQSGGGTSGWGQARGNVEWTLETLQRFNVTPDMAGGEVHLHAITNTGDFYEDKNGNTTLTYYGYATDAAGNVLGQYTGMRQGLNTWADLSGVKDVQNWYAYDANAYIQQSDVDLFFSSNLVFTAQQSSNSIVLDSSIDLGIGYVEFNSGDLENASFTITSAEGEGHVLNSAGYVINAGAEVHLQLNNPADYMYEWRKNGAGDLYIDGTGNTNALLTLGGSGVTYLQQKNGAAAYNVLLGSGATVVINDINQIQRDVTFGNGGGVLDMNGNSMDWYTNTTVETAGFSINALTEEALIANTKAGSTATLTFKQSAEQTFLGSFADTQDAALVIDYQGAGTWMLHSIHTDMSHHAGSGFIVSNGQVVFSGIHTVHGRGSAVGHTVERLERENDWHYADASMNVQVKSGATFELGSHARLTGDVTVAQGGTFIMREGVKDRYEYVEGGVLLEDTYQYSPFYGLHGDVKLSGTMLVEYSTGTTANTTLTGNISGSGDLIVKAGTTGGSITFSGDNSELTGLKQIVSGGVIATTLKGLGHESKSRWLIGRQGWLASHEFTDSTDILSYIDTDSTGTLALSNKLTAELDLSNHQGLFIGAEAGKVVEYGVAGEELTAINGEYKLGGGGGELIVHFKLTGASTNLLLGADASSTGTVTLTNADNDFGGTISFAGAGITLNAAEGALGQSTLSLSYGNALATPNASALGNLDAASDGMFLLNQLADASLSVAGLKNLALGASEDVSYTGTLTVADGALYRLGTTQGATLTLGSTLSDAHDLLIDAQGSSGGTVKLAGNATYAGDITVQGHKDSSAAGDITLTFGRDMQLGGTITLNNGGTLDVAGHTITVQGDIVGAGGSITNSGWTGPLDAERTGELVFHAAEGQQITASAPMMVPSLRKTGAGSLTLAAANTYTNFYLDGGSLILGHESASGMYGTVHMAGGTTLDLATYHLVKNTYTNAESIVMAANAGTATVLQSGTVAGQISEIGGDIVLGSGSQLNLVGDGIFAVGSTLATGSQELKIGGTGAVVHVDAPQLTLNTSYQVTIAGTLSFADDAKLYSNGESKGMVRNIEHLRLEQDSTLTLAERSGTSYWSVGQLSGSGTLQWDSTTNQYEDGSGTASRLVLKGESDFEGHIILNRNTGEARHTHGAYIELAHNQAAQYADITLNGINANGRASLAINTANANLKGLSGNAFSYTFAGAAGSQVVTGDNHPASTRKSILTINTDAGTTYTYAGVLGNSADTLATGLDIVKLGAGTQAFTGTAQVGHVTVGGGTLSFAAGAGTALGNITLDGGTLSGLDYTLAADKSFTVNNTSAFSGTLTLAGGQFIIDALAFSNSSTVLTLGGVAVADGVTQTITLNNALQLGAGTYTLATGDWTSVLEKLGGISMKGYDAAWNTNDSGHLQLVISTKTGTVLWDGSDAAHEWSSTQFGSTANALGESSIALFKDTAANTHVRVTEDITVAETAFANISKDYTITSAGGTVTAGTLYKDGSGEVVLNSGLRVTGTTTIQAGTITLRSGDILAGTITGEGTLKLDTGDHVGSLSLDNLHTLHIASGSYGTAADAALSVRNIIVQSGGTYVQGAGAEYTGNTILEGGTIVLNGGLLAGSMEVNADSYLNIAAGSETSLNLSLTQNDGAAIIQTGGGVISIVGGGNTRLQNYVVREGTLNFLQWNWGGHDNQGILTVEGGAKLQVAWGAGLQAEQIHLKSGATLQLANGDGLNAWWLQNYTKANILVEDGAIISGSAGDVGSYVQGTISGSGTLNLANAASVTNAKAYRIESAISDGSSALGLNIANTSVSFTGANTYSGGTVIDAASTVTTGHATALGSGAVQNAGALVMEENLQIGGLSGAGSLNTNGHILMLNNSADMSFSGAVSGQGAIVQMGSGTSTFSSNVDLGAAGVTAGHLILAGANNTLSEGAVVSAAGELTLAGNITLGGMIENAGTVNIAADVTFNLELRDFTNGVYTLVVGTGSVSYADTFAEADFTISGQNLSSLTSQGIQVAITQSNNAFTIAFTNGLRDLTWTGATSGDWNMTDANWGASSETELMYGLMDYVTFDNSAARKDVTIAEGTLPAKSMTVSGTGYTFTGVIDVQDTFRVEEGASATLNTMPSSLAKATVLGELTLAFGGTWTQDIDASAGTIRKTGTGTLTWNPAGGTLQMGTLDVQQGYFMSSSAMEIGTFSLGTGAVALLTNTTTADAAAKNIQQVLLGNNSYFCIQDNEASSIKTAIGEVVLMGDKGEFQDYAAGKNSYIGIDKLSLGEGISSSTLTLSAMPMTNTTVYELGAQDAEVGNFAGTIVLKGNNAHAALILSGAQVAGQAVVNLNASNSTYFKKALGINVDNAEIAGLVSAQSMGNETKLFSGTVTATTAFNTANITNAATRNLIINTAANTSYTFYGEVLQGVNLTKTGAGTQAFAGTVGSASVAVLGGTLDMTAAALTDSALADVTLGRGAQLSMGNLNLTTGKSLSVLGDEMSGTAMLNGSLTLGGGSLSFDSLALGSTTAALTVGGSISMSAGTQVITLTGSESLVLNQGYYLLSGNFADGITADSFRLAGLAAEYTGTLSLSNGGLWLTLTDAPQPAIPNGNIWAGTAEYHTWDSTTFGVVNIGAMGSNPATFDDSAAHRDILLKGSVQAASGVVFNNTEDYTFNFTNINSSLTTPDMVMNGEGTVHMKVALHADALRLNNGRLVLSDYAVLGADTALSMTGDAVMNITSTTQTLSNLSMAAGTRIEDTRGTGTLKLVAAEDAPMALQGVVNVGTVATQGAVSLSTGDATHTLQLGDTTLTLNNAFALTEGKTIEVLGQATLNAAVTMAGGTLMFDNAVLSDSTASLALGQAPTLAEGGMVNISVADLDALRSGGTFVLASGDWSAFSAEDFTLTGAPYAADLATFTINGNTLSMTLVAHDVWAGTAADYSWNTTTFGPNAALGSSTMAIFDNSAENTAISLTESVQVGDLRFDNNKSYSITATQPGATITGGNFTKAGTGDVIINADLNLSGDANLTNGNITFAGTTQIAGNVTQATGNVTLSGENSVMGDYTITGGTLNVTGAGSSLGVVRTNANVTFQAESATMAGLAINAGIRVQFLKPGDSDAAAYAIRNNNGNAVLDFATWHASFSQILVEDGVSLTIDRINSSWGWNRFEINGDVVVNDSVHLSSGSQNPFIGTGTLTAKTMTLTNTGTYVFDLSRVTVKEHLSIGWSGKGVLQSGVLTSETKTTQTSSSMSVQGGILNLGGTSSFTGGTLSLASGKIDITDGVATISNHFTMSGGTLALTGGTTTLSSNNVSFTGGDVLIDGGVLKSSTTAARALLGGVDSLSLISGTLDISAINFSTSADAIVMKEGASFTFSGGTIALGTLQQDTTYQIFDATNGTLEGWTTLSAANFEMNGVSMTNMGRVELTLGAAGTFAYTQQVYDLTWVGGSSTEWNNTDANWDITPDADADATNNEKFYNADSATFVSDATLSVAQGVSVNNLTLAANTTLTTSGNLSVSGTISGAEGSKWVLDGSATAFTQSLTGEQIKDLSALEVGEGATLQVSDKQNGFNPENITGSGKVVVGLNSNWGHLLKLGADFTGETYVTSGSFDLTGAQVGSTLRLASGVNTNSATGATTLTADLILEGTTTIHANSSKAITYAGTVTGAQGVLKTNGGSSHTFQKAVNLAGMDTDNTATLNFNDTVSLGSMTLDANATVNYNGASAAITNLAQTTGVSNFNSDSATVGTLKLTGGTFKVTGGQLTVGAVHADTTGGTLQVAGGALNFAAGVAQSLLEKVGSFTLSSGTLDLADVAFGADSSNAIALKEGATFTFSGGAIALGSLQQGTTYQIFDATNGTLNGWATLDKSNFTVDGSALTSLGRVQLSLGESGTFSYSILGAQTLTWVGGSSTEWNTADANWDITPDADAANNEAFYNGDSVVFATAGTSVTLNQDVTVGSMTVNESLELAGSGSIATNSLVLNAGLNMQGATLTFTGASTLTANGSAEASIQNINLASASSLSVTPAAEATVSLGNITGGGALSMAGTGTLTLGHAQLASLSMAKIAAGGDNAATLGTVNVTGAVNISGMLEVGDATLNINNGGSITTQTFRGATRGKGADSVVTINSGASLTITGTQDVDGETTSFLLTHWGSTWGGDSGSMDLLLNGGTLTAEQTSMHMGWDSGSSFRALSGSASLKGVRFSSNKGNADSFALGTATEGSAQINIGSSGFSGIGANDTVSLGEGTLRATADFAISGATGAALSFVGGVQGTIIDTNGYTITAETALSGAGKLVKRGEGTLSLTATSSAFTGSVALENGSLVLNTDSVSVLEGASALMMSGGVLDLTRLNFGGESADTISLATGANFSFTSGTIALGEIQENTVYHIFDTTNGGTLTGWTSLTSANFTFGGASLDEEARLVLGEDGTLKFYTSVPSLTWDKGIKGDWDTTSTNWDSTAADGDATNNMAYTAGADAHFNSNMLDVNVTEDISAGKIVLADGAQLLAVNVAEGVTWSASGLELGVGSMINTTGALQLSGDITSAADSKWKLTAATDASGVQGVFTQSLTGAQVAALNALEVGAGVTLQVSDVQSSFNPANISGAGKVELSLTTGGTYHTLNLGENFTGETYVTSGHLNLSSAKVGSTLRLAGGVNLNAEGLTVVPDIILEGRTSVINGGTTAFQGTITGEGTFVHASGNGYFRFMDEVDLGGYEQSGTGTWYRDTFHAVTTLGSVKMKGQGYLAFRNDSTIDTLTVSGTNGTFFESGHTHTLTTATISGGSVYFNAALGNDEGSYTAAQSSSAQQGTTNIGTLTITGGTVNFNGDTTIGTATISGGTTNFANTTNLTTLNVTGGTVVLRNVAAASGAQKHIGTVKLGNEAVLTQFSGGSMPSEYTHLGIVELTGAKATIKETNFGGAISIGTLKTSNAGGTSQLVLEYNHSADNFSLVKLGSATAEAGNFAGTITMDGTNNGNYRAAALIIENAGIAKNAVIDIELPDSSSAEYAVGINADNTTIAGLNSAADANRGNQYTLFSGSINLQQRDQVAALSFDSNWIQNAAHRTLTFNVAEGGNYTFTGNVVKTATSGLNLVKTGAGSQTISGVAAVGSLTVQEGTLALTNAASTASGDITVSGGSLTFAGSYTLGAEQVLSVLTGGADSVLLGGLTLDGGVLAFDAATLMTDAAALKVAGTVGAGTGATVTLDFSKLTGAMQSGTYMLAAGNWAGAQLSYGGTEGMNISATESGLFLTYTNDSVYTWVAGAVDGEGAADNSWSAANWDLVPDEDSGNNQLFATGKDAVFNTNATVNVTNAVSADTVSILNGAQVTLGMGGEGASFAANELIVANGKLTLGSEKNWSGIKDITIKADGVLELAYGTGINNSADATDILLQGGTINLRNGHGTHTTLHADITVDGTGTIAGSLFGDYTTISGTITGDGTLTFAKDLVDNGTNPITVSSAITDGADGSLALTIKDTQVKLSGANTYTGATTVSGGTLELTGAVSMNAASSISLAAGTTLLLNATNTAAMTLGNDITGTGTIHKKGGSETVLSGDVDVDLVKVADGANQVTKAGTLSFTGDSVAVNKLYLAYGQVNVGDTNGAETFMTLGQLQSGDSYEASSTVGLQVYQGATLTVTGNNNGTGGNQPWKNASFLLSEWNAAATVDVAGTLLVQHANASLGDDVTTININGGIMAVQGIGQVRENTGGALNLNLTQGGKLILGANGLTTSNNSVDIQLGKGTVGLSAAETTIAENVTLTSAEGTTFDTTQYTYVNNADGVATDTVRGAEAGSMEISGNISSAEGVAAKMKVAGNGELLLTGNANVSGGLEVEKGAVLTTAALSMGSTAGADSSAAAVVKGAVSISATEGTARIDGADDAPGRIDNSLITLAQGASLTVDNMIISESSRISGKAVAATFAAREAATPNVTLTRSTIELGNGNAELAGGGAPITINPGTLTAMDGTSSTVQMSGDFTALGVQSSALDSLTLNAGSSFVVDFSSLLADVSLDTIDLIELSFSGVTYESLSDITISGVYNGTQMTAYYLTPADSAVAHVGSIYFAVDSIPEPTTTTLSILALAALAARRRRK